jgi:hypothetical protein
LEGLLFKFSRTKSPDFGSKVLQKVESRKALQLGTERPYVEEELLRFWAVKLYSVILHLIWVLSIHGNSKYYNVWNPYGRLSK